MTRARKQLISLDDTPYYHCIARCVRRSFLCGKDKYTGKDFNHRRQWLVDQFKFQTEIFCIEVAAYAVMNNHYHLVLFIDAEKAENLSDKQIAMRWTQLFHGPLLIQRFIQEHALTDAEQLTVVDIVALWRKRLMDISWFMRVLNEHIARRANEEDNCKGRFWEGRFRSQALLDDHALLSCMMYVDLNPVRAGIAGGLEDSDFTSIQDRIRDQKTSTKLQEKDSNNSEKNTLRLSDFIGDETNNTSCKGIPFSFDDYLVLTEWAGRCVRANKRGHIIPKAPTEIHKLGMDAQRWLHLCYNVQRSHPVAVGDTCSLQEYNDQHNKCWTIIVRNE